MRIVDVCEFYAERGGGVKTYAHEKLAAGARAGHEVVILAPGEGDSERSAFGGRIVTIPAPKLPVDTRYHMFSSTPRIHAALDRLAPDVIEASSPYLAAHAVGSYPQAHDQKRRAKSLVFHQDPIAVYPHTFLDRWFARSTLDRAFDPYWSYLRKLSQHYDVTVTSGEWLAQRLAGLGVHAPTAVPFGIDKQLFVPERRDPVVRAQWLERCGAPSDAELVVSVGRHHPEKRLHVVIEAVARAAKEHDHPIALVLVGDGPLRKLVTYWSRKLKHVSVAGFVEGRAQMAATLASADAVLHASAAETYGLSVAEAICAGTPVVVPDSGGASDLAQPEYSESYRTGDAASAAEALLRLLRRDRAALRQACASQGRKRISPAAQHFEDLFALYARLSKTP